MKKIILILAILLSVSIASTGASAATLTAKDKGDIKKVLVSARNWIKQGNYEKSVQYLDFEEMGRILMKGYWDKMGQADRNDIIEYMKQMIKTKFDIIQKRLAGLKFSEPRIDEGKVVCKTVVVFDRSVDKKDQVIDIGLVKRPSGWKMVEVYIIGEGFLSGLNEDKVKPIMKRGGSLEEVKSTVKVVFE